MAKLGSRVTQPIGVTSASNWEGGVEIFIFLCYACEFLFISVMSKADLPLPPIIDASYALQPTRLDSYCVGLLKLF